MRGCLRVGVMTKAMARVLSAMSQLVYLAVLVRYSSSIECPASLATPDGSQDALGNGRLNVYLDEADFEGGKRDRMGGAPMTLQCFSSSRAS